MHSSTKNHQPSKRVYKQTLYTVREAKNKHSIFTDTSTYTCRDEVICAHCSFWWIVVIFCCCCFGLSLLWTSVSISISSPKEPGKFCNYTHLLIHCVSTINTKAKKNNTSWNQSHGQRNREKETKSGEKKDQIRTQSMYNRAGNKKTMKRKIEMRWREQHKNKMK